eukprot:m.129687 g.129687  ORF g.129687 m.129687 type:complete len:165 (-) comp15856_c0_seq2:419-913(-)
MTSFPLWQLFGFAEQPLAPTGDDRVIKALAAMPEAKDEPPPICIAGDGASGKTTLLFHWAVAAAQKASDGKVIFITQSKSQLAAHKPRACSLRPSLPQDALERVELRYLADHQELVQYLCCCHMDPDGRPAAIVIDDIHLYTKVGAFSCASHQLLAPNSQHHQR